MTYIPLLDGLRALAVSLVILNHLDGFGFGGGYIGVDIFFVISGYLITTILATEDATSSRNTAAGVSKYINDRAFYFKRARRILPVAIVVLVLSFLIVIFEQGIAAFSKEGMNALWAISFLSNFHLMSEATDYFASDLTQKSFFQHYWSLAVEEQFYLFYPVLFLFISKLHGLRSGAFRLHWYRRLLIALILCWTASFSANFFGVQESPTQAYFSTFTRMWEIISGCLLALFVKFFKLQIPSERKLSLFRIVGLTAIVLSSVFYTDNTVYPGIPALVPVLGSLLLIYGSLYSSGSEGVIVRFFSLKLVRYLGKISYSLYLIHWPLLLLFTRQDYFPINQVLGKIVYLVTLVFLSGLSFAIIERPTRKIPVPISLLSVKKSPLSFITVQLRKIDGDIWFIGITLCLLISIFTSVKSYNPTVSSQYDYQPFTFPSADASPNNDFLSPNSMPQADSQLNPIDESVKSLNTLPPDFETYLQRWQSNLNTSASNPLLNSQSQTSISLVKSKSVQWGTSPIWRNCVNSNSIDGRAQFSCDFSNMGRGKKISVLLVGDSHAQQFIPTIVTAFTSKNLQLNVFGRTGCFIGGVVKSNSAKSDLACQDLWQTQAQIQFANKTFDFVFASDLGQDSAIQSKINSFKFLKSLTPNLILIAPTPKYPVFESCKISGKRITECTGIAPQAASSKYSLLAANVGARFFPATDFLCVNGQCPPIVNNHFVHIGDGGHLSGAVANELAMPLKIFLGLDQ